MPQDALTCDVVFRLENQADVGLRRYPLTGTLTIGNSGRITLSITAASCTPNGQPAASFAVYDVTTGQRIVVAAPNGAGFYGQAAVDPDVFDLLIVPVDAQGNEDHAQAVSLQR